MGCATQLSRGQKLTDSHTRFTFNTRIQLCSCWSDSSIKISSSDDRTFTDEALTGSLLDSAHPPAADLPRAICGVVTLLPQSNVLKPRRR
jgi:hypothetical protein